MDIIKFRVTLKGVKIEVHNSKTYIFDLNKAVDLDLPDREVLLRLFTALDLLFKKESITGGNDDSLPNQTNIIEHISATKELE